MGFFFDKFGPRMTYIKSAVFLFAGYGLMWAGAIGKIWSNNIAMGLYMVFVGYGSVAGYMAGLLTNTKNFRPEHRGKIVAVLVAAYGLSAAIFSQVYHHTFNHNVGKFFWLMAIVLGSLPIIGIFLVQYVPIDMAPLPSSSPTPESSLFTIQDTPQADLPVGLDEHQVLTQNTLSPPSSPSPAPTTPLLHAPGKYGDLRGLPVLKSPEFLLLFAVVFCCTGVGLTWINIIGNIVKSYKITAIPASGYVIGLSVANALGRLLFGFLTDLKAIRLPPVYLMIPCLAILIFTHVVLIWITNQIYLLVVTLLTGLSYGGSFAIMPVIINKYFGDKNYGSNLGLLILAVAIGSMAMGAISGAIYDHEAAYQLTHPNSVMRTLSSGATSHLCFGLACFRWTFVMTTLVSIVGLVIAVVLLRREMQFDSRHRRGGDFDVMDSERAA